jgi:hypothetical protein
VAIHQLPKPTNNRKSIMFDIDTTTNSANSELHTFKVILDTPSKQTFDKVAKALCTQLGLPVRKILDALSHAVAAVSPALLMEEGDALAASMVNLEHLVDQPLRRGGITHEEYENWTEVDHSHEARKERLRHLLEVQRCEIGIGYNDPRLQTTIEALNKQIQTYKRQQYAAPRDDIAPMPYLPR